MGEQGHPSRWETTPREGWGHGGGIGFQQEKKSWEKAKGRLRQVAIGIVGLVWIKVKVRQGTTTGKRERKDDRAAHKAQFQKNKKGDHWRWTLEVTKGSKKSTMKGGPKLRTTGQSLHLNGVTLGTDRRSLACSEEVVINSENKRWGKAKQMV